MKQLTLKWIMVVLLSIQSFISYSQCLPSGLSYRWSDEVLIDTVCPWDTTNIINTLEKVSVFQTLDDTYNGLVDSTKCVNFKDTLGNIGFDPNQLDSTKKIFIKIKFPIETSNCYNIDSNSFYYCNLHMSNLQVEFDDLFSTYLIVQVPDSSQTNYLDRVNKFTSMSNTNYYYHSFCFMSERMTNQKLKEIILEFNIKNIDTSSFVKFQNFEMMYNEINSIFTKITDDIYVNNSNNYMYLGGPLPIIVYYTLPSFPSPSQICKYNVYPFDTTTTTQDTITIVNETDLVFQQYTELIGAPVNGNPSLNHILQYNIFTSECSQSVERLATHHRHLKNYGNGINFANETGCVQIGSFGKYIITEGIQFDYGNENNIGMMLLKPDGDLVLEKNSTISFHNTLLIKEEDYDTEIRNPRIVLNPNTSFVFKKGSHLKNMSSNYPQLKLDIYMNGGTLDESALSEDERQLINKIYPETVKNNNSLFVYPNPAQDKLYITLNKEDKDVQSIHVINVEGKQTHLNIPFQYKNHNTIEINIDNLNNGLQFLEIQTTNSKYLSKFIHSK